MDESIIKFKDKDLTNYSWMKTPFRGDLVIVKNLDSLIKFIKECNQKGIEYKILGNGSNILFHNFKGPYLKLDLSDPPFPFFSASSPLSKIIKIGEGNRNESVSIFTGIPGTLGGAIAMNAGTSLGEIKDILASVDSVTKDGTIKHHEVIKDSFGYRKNNFLEKGEVVYQARLDLNFKITKSKKDLIQKRSEQPKSNTLGSTFKNGADYFAGKLIEECDLKGLIVGGIRISERHANFLENFNNGTSNDVISIIDIIKKRVKEKKGVELELEIKVY